MEKRTEQGWVFFYDTQHIQKEVENITTTIASVPVGEAGQKRMWLAMNEDHNDLFQRYIKDAVSDIRTACNKWIEPEHPSDDMRRVDRVHLHTKLWLKEAEHIPAQVRVIDDKIREYLIYKIIYEWMLLKSPEEAANIYLPRVQSLLEELKHQFANSEGWHRRRYRLF